MTIELLQFKHPYLTIEYTKYFFVTPQLGTNGSIECSMDTRDTKVIQRSYRVGLRYLMHKDSRVLPMSDISLAVGTLQRLGLLSYPTVGQWRVLYQNGSLAIPRRLLCNLAILAFHSGSLKYYSHIGVLMLQGVHSGVLGDLGRNQGGNRPSRGFLSRTDKGLGRNQYSVAIHKLRRVPTMVTLTLWAIEPYPTVGLRRDTSIARSYDYVIQ